MNHQLQESIGNLAEATAATDTERGVLEVEFITPGWGSSGYYSREVVEAAAPLFTRGLHMYLDHPTDEESVTRPGRSVKDLAAVVTEARYDKTRGSVVGKVKPFAPYRELLLDEDFAANIGLSIRGSATDIVEGEAEGRRGGIIEGLADIASVDFVTRAGRGGRVLQVLESATPVQVNARAVAHGVEEATADERRTQLSNAVRSAYGGSDRYAWVQDFDDSKVWFQESPENDAARYWEQTYSVNDGDTSVSLTGERTEVRQVTRYLPIAATDTSPPATRPGSTTATESEEDTSMGNIQIEESEHTRLVAEAGRVSVLEGERDTAVAERDQARNDLATERRTNRAQQLLTESEHSFDSLQTAGLLVGLPTTEEGALDETAFTTRVNEAAARLAEQRGAGQVRGFGGQQSNDGGGTTVSESDIDNAVGSAFGRKGD